MDILSSTERICSLLEFNARSRVRRIPCIEHSFKIANLMKSGECHFPIRFLNAFRSVVFYASYAFVNMCCRIAIE